MHIDNINSQYRHLGVKASSIVRCLLNDLNEIRDILDGREWNADTSDQIAQVLRRRGYKLRPPQD